MPGGKSKKGTDILWRKAHADAAGLQAVLIGPDDPEIIALEAGLRSAQLAGDVDALDRLISEQL
ncbi:MAG TPA: hypothetical protein VEU28_06000, partial [Actinomycetota bacterium]|nr:hypothetical protein [Actinomycetota bacterium]